MSEMHAINPLTSSTELIGICDYRHLRFARVFEIVAVGIITLMAVYFGLAETFGRAMSRTAKCVAFWCSLLLLAVDTANLGVKVDCSEKKWFATSVARICVFGLCKVGIVVLALCKWMKEMKKTEKKREDAWPEPPQGGHPWGATHIEDTALTIISREWDKAVAEQIAAVQHIRQRNPS